MNGIDNIADAQAKRLAEKLAKQEQKTEHRGPPPALTAAAAEQEQPTVPQPAAQPQPMAVLHVEIYSDESYKVQADFRQPELLFSCITLVLQTFVQQQVKAGLQNAIAKAEAQVPRSQLPMWHRVRGAMRSVLGMKPH